MFMHGGWMHLFGNMLFLWIFGDNVEDRFGHVKFLIFYLLAGIAATFAQFALAPHSTVPNVGASGAIAGVLGAYILMFPQARVNVLLGRQIVAMPAVIVLGMWIALQLFSGVGTIAYTDESANVGRRRLHGPYRRLLRRLPDGVPVPPRGPTQHHGVRRATCPCLVPASARGCPTASTANRRAPRPRRAITMTHRKPWRLSVNGSPPTFMPKMPAIRLAGRKTVVTMASTCKFRFVCSAVLSVTSS